MNGGNKMEEISIRRADNGFIVTYEEENDNNMPTKTREYVFEIEFSEFGELKAMQGTLHQVLEFFGLQGSKHDKSRLYIELEEKK